ncbi:uncharacterized protein [Pyrus communis]|uniref:uncharacterized protein n=1 Tax=Pyrus communis TaxID=23211 RepID=UPI0035BF357E
MVTANQLQIMQPPITSLISTVSTLVTIKLDDSNYLTWHFQMQLLLECHGIMGFLNGSNPCPTRFVSSGFGGSNVDYGDSSSRTETDAYKVWKMHDRALMQLIIVTLSPSAMKSELQNIKKWPNSISQYLQRIKETSDYLAATEVHFEDDDIVILTLNGLSG